MPEVKQSAARDNILARLSHHAIAVDPGAEDYGVMTSQEWDEDARLTRFCELLQNAHAEVLRVPKEACVAEIATLLHHKNIKSVLLSEGTELGIKLQEQLPETLDIRHYPETVESFKQAMFTEIQAGVTQARWGIAETGTLVLWPDKNEPRTMSLVPPLHIAVVDAATIVNTFFELLSTANWVEQGMPSNALLISGPSKTADIQQVLAYGAHGPCELVVIVCE